MSTEQGNVVEIVESVVATGEEWIIMRDHHSVAVVMRYDKYKVLIEQANPSNPATTGLLRYAVRCDECKVEMRRTDSLHESACGGLCNACRREAP